MTEPTEVEFAEYRIERRLTASPAVITVLARHRRLDRVDDLTILSVPHSSDDRFRQRFLEAAELAARQRHPNLAVVRDAGVQNGHLWVASQHVDGVDVADMIRLDGLDPARTVNIVGEVAKGLDELHAHGLRHGDLKPADVVVVERPGQPDQVVLTGYGLARPDTDPRLPADQAAAPGYRAPEQLAGLPGDHRTDVFALGCLLSEMLTGIRPGPTGPQPPSTQNPWLPVAFDAVVARATAPDPADRYPDCASLARAAIEAAGVSADAPARHPRPRRALLAVAAVVIVAAAVGISVWAVPGKQSAAPQSPGPTTTASRSPELKTALWGAYSYVAEAFPDLLPVSADGIGYQELYNCHATDQKGNDASLYESAAVGELWCWGNTHPVWSVYLTCNADRSPMRPQQPRFQMEGEELWTRPTGTGYLRWGTYQSNAQQTMAMLEVYFDNPRQSFCRLKVQASGSASDLHTQWWPGVSV